MTPHRQLRIISLILIACILAGIIGAAVAANAHAEVDTQLRPPAHRVIVRTGTVWPYDRSSWYKATQYGYNWIPGVTCTRRGWSRIVVCR